MRSTAATVTPVPPAGPVDVLALGDAVRARWADRRPLSAHELAAHAELLERVDPVARASLEAQRVLHERASRLHKRLLESHLLTREEEQEVAEFRAIAPDSLLAGMGELVYSHECRRRDAAQRAAELAKKQALADRWTNLPRADRALYLMLDRVDAPTKRVLLVILELLELDDEDLKALEPPKEFGRPRSP